MGPPGPVWTDAKIFAPPQTVQPVASRCTDCAVPGYNRSICIKFLAFVQRALADDTVLKS